MLAQDNDLSTPLAREDEISCFSAISDFPAATSSLGPNVEVLIRYCDPDDVGYMNQIERSLFNAWIGEVDAPARWEVVRQRDPLVEVESGMFVSQCEANPAYAIRLVDRPVEWLLTETMAPAAVSRASSARVGGMDKGAAVRPGLLDRPCALAARAERSRARVADERPIVSWVLISQAPPPDAAKVLEDNLLARSAFAEPASCVQLLKSIVWLESGVRPRTRLYPIREASEQELFGPSGVQ